MKGGNKYTDYVFRKTKKYTTNIIAVFAIFSKLVFIYMRLFKLLF